MTPSSEGNARFICAGIVGVSIIIAALILAYLPRYEAIPGTGPVHILDKVTGTVYRDTGTFSAKGHYWERITLHGGQVIDR